MRSCLSISAAALLALSGAAVAQEDLIQQGEEAFQICAACHEVGEGAQHLVGPQLNDLFGRVAGSLEDYEYSEAMIEAGQGNLVWEDDTIDQFIADPEAMIPGTLMVAPPIEDAEERAAIIAYLRTFE
jgi:cytochrome c2